MKWIILLLVFTSNVYATNLSSVISDPVDVIIADKSDGNIYLWKNESKTLFKAPALFGKTYSDFFSQAEYDSGKVTGFITPAGTFAATKMYSTYMSNYILAFVYGKKYVLAIHPVVIGKTDQRRLERLNSPEGGDNRITNGCINVPAEFFYTVLYTLPDKTKLVVLPEKDLLIDDVSSQTPSVKMETVSSDLGGFAGYTGK